MFDFIYKDCSFGVVGYLHTNDRIVPFMRSFQRFLDFDGALLIPAANSMYSVLFFLQYGQFTLFVETAIPQLEQFMIIC